MNNIYGPSLGLWSILLWCSGLFFFGTLVYPLFFGILVNPLFFGTLVYHLLCGSLVYPLFFGTLVNPLFFGTLVLFGMRECRTLSMYVPYRAEKMSKFLFVDILLNLFI